MESDRICDDVKLTRLADVEPECVSWLWPGRIPLGKLVVIDGDPGLGKSTLANEIGATVTIGGVWPDGTSCAFPGAVLIMSAEDGLPDTVRPRSDAAGADVNRVFAIEGVTTIDADGNRALRPPTLADITVLKRVITATGARLLIIDVVMAYLPHGTDAHKDQDIRRVLSALSALANETGCTVLLLRHLNKASGRDPLYRGGGSIGIVGAARSGLLVARDPDDDNRRVLVSVKSNLGPTPESLTYSLVDAPEYGCARIQWEGRSVHTAHSVLAESLREGDRTAATEAELWLHDYLTKQGAAPSQAVKTEAAKVGIKERTLQRATEKLRVLVDSRGFPRVTWWQLPSDANAPETTPVSQNLGATGATESDLRKRNGATGQISQSRQGPRDGVTGGPTEHTPGMTDRVKAIVAKHHRPADQEEIA